MYQCLSYLHRADRSFDKNLPYHEKDMLCCRTDFLAHQASCKECNKTPQCHAAAGLTRLLNHKPSSPPSPGTTRLQLIKFSLPSESCIDLGGDIGGDFFLLENISSLLYLLSTRLVPETDLQGEQYGCCLAFCANRRWQSL